MDLLYHMGEGAAPPDILGAPDLSRPDTWVALGLLHELHPGGLVPDPPLSISLVPDSLDVPDIPPGVMLQRTDPNVTKAPQPAKDRLKAECNTKLGVKVTLRKPTAKGKQYTNV